MVKNTNKKAQIGATLTWIIATVIIVFLIFIFIGIIGIKKISGDKTSEAGVSSLGKNDLFLTESFFVFLNKKLNSGKTIKDLIFEWAEYSNNNDIIENEFKNFFKNSNFECSIADINHKSKDITIENLEAYGGRRYSRARRADFLDESIEFNLISNKVSLIGIRIYAGECL